MPNKQKWEIQLAQLTLIAWKNGLWHSESDLNESLKDFISKLLSEREQKYGKIINDCMNKAREEQARSLPPAIGVSAWLSYGKKYGYDEFFTDKFRQEILKHSAHIEKGVLAKIMK